MDTVKDKIYSGDPKSWPQGTYLDFRDKSLLVVRDGDKTWCMSVNDLQVYSKVVFIADERWQYKRLEDQDA